MRNLLLAILSVLFLVTGAFAGEKDKIKAGFVYVGPVGDHGGLTDMTSEDKTLKNILAIESKQSMLRTCQKEQMPKEL